MQKNNHFDKDKAISIHGLFLIHHIEKEKDNISFALIMCHAEVSISDKNHNDFIYLYGDIDKI